MVAGAPVSAAPVDKQIAAALKEVSPDKIRGNIEALLQFGNRSTLSSAETDLPPGTGILAAADWIQEQFESYSKACGGCLEVKVDAFVEQPGVDFGRRLIGEAWRVQQIQHNLLLRSGQRPHRPAPWTNHRSPGLPRAA